MRTGIAAAMMVQVLVGCLFAEDSAWPKWRGPDGDGICREVRLAERWPEEGPKIIWQDKTGKGFASPVAAGGKVCLFAVIDRKDTLIVYDAANGQRAWSASYSNSFLVTHGGTRATPVIDKDLVYTLGGAGDLVCRKFADGTPVWHINVLTETKSKNLTWGTASSPLIVGDTIYLQVACNGPTAVAVSKKDGTVTWESESREQASYAPIVQVEAGGKKQLIVFGGKSIIAMDPANGKTIWTYPWTTEFDVNAATPICRDGRLFLSSGYNHGSIMLRLTGDKPEKLWETKKPDCKFPSPVLDGDCLYATGEKSGTLGCYNWADGKELWMADNKQIPLGFGGSMLRLPNSRAIAISDTGRLFLLEATRESVKIISQAKPITDKDVWSTPLVYQGRLYLKIGPSFACLDIAGK